MVTMDVPDELGWALVGGRREGDSVPELPADLWSSKWRSARRRIPFKGPIDGVCEVESTTRTQTVAVREVSNGVYLPAMPRVL
ncbi:hypothetical protein [Aeromicrobium sp. IC_218]|uniref:hypothetical protein n=1 Tax=Aeromicrobium sp. IC_218 TaxID=2545468 RepID=UPI001A9547E8|nr:hypothetical protein [Aeromicrobium sp. IC_218]